MTVPQDDVSDENRRPLGHQRRVVMNLKALVLLLLFVGFLLIALLVFPKDSPVSAQGGIPYLEFGSNFVPTGVEVTEIPDKSVDGINLLLTLYDNTNPGGGALVQFEVPRMAWGGRTKCSARAKCSSLVGDNNFEIRVLRIARSMVTSAVNQWS